MSLILDAILDNSKALKGVNQLVNKAGAQMKKLDAESTKASGRMATGFQKVSTVLGPLGIGVAIGGAISLMKSAVTAASNLNESVNAVNVTFGEGSQQILNFGKTAATQIGLANSEFNQLSTVTGALLKTTGKPMKEVANLTIDVGKRAADMASVFNTSVKDALFAFNAGLRGETEPLRRFAIDVTDNTLKQEALAQGITKSVTQMTQQEKTLLRLQSIMRQSEGVAGDFQKTSGEFANQTRILKSRWEDFTAHLGSFFIPAASGTVKALNSIIEATREAKVEIVDFREELEKLKLPTLEDVKNATDATALNIKDMSVAAEATNTAFGNIIAKNADLSRVFGTATVEVIEAAEKLANLPPPAPIPPDTFVPLTENAIPAAEKLIQLYDEQTSRLDQVNQFLREGNTEIEKAPEFVQELTKEMRVAQAISQDLAGAFFDAATGSANLLDSVKQIAKELAKRAFVSFISSLIPGGGLVGGLFGGFFQHGGRPPVGRPSIVGERGPEVFIPDRPGRIVPNNQITNNTGGNITINVTAQQFDETFVKFRLFPIMRQAQKQGFKFA